MTRSTSSRRAASSGKGATTGVAHQRQASGPEAGLQRIAGLVKAGDYSLGKSLLCPVAWPARLLRCTQILAGAPEIGDVAIRLCQRQAQRQRVHGRRIKGGLMAVEPGQAIAFQVKREGFIGVCPARYIGL